MGGVDVLDQELKYYSMQRRSLRWTFKFSLHLIQTIIFNSYVLYKTNTQDEKIISHLDYNLSAVQWFYQWKEIKHQGDNIEINNINENKNFQYSVKFLTFHYTTKLK